MGPGIRDELAFTGNVAHDARVNPYQAPKTPSSEAARASKARRVVFAWVLAVAVVLVGSVLGEIAVVALSGEEGPPAVLVLLPWPTSLALGWFVKRKLSLAA
jgi:hypothetical protein